MTLYVVTTLCVGDGGGAAGLFGVGQFLSETLFSNVTPHCTHEVPEA